MRSEITIDLGALRRNVDTLMRAADGAEVWAVVKANAYGHGAVDCAGAALEAGARALCVATVGEALVLRRELAEARLLVLGPASDEEVAAAREAGLELVVSSDRIPEGVPVHVKLDTGMGRWGVSELPAPTRDVVGLMTHLATADTDSDFALLQIERFRAATDSLAHLTRHVANSAATLADPGVAVRRRSLRDRPLRPVAVRARSGRARPRTGALVEERDRADEATPGR